MVLLGNKIKELRIKSRFTQSELAERLGVTKSSIASYENDSRQPSYEVLIKISQVFNVSIDSLLLNRSGITLDIDGLKREQIKLLELLIVNYKKGNLIEEYFRQSASKEDVEAIEKLEEKYGIKLEGVY